MNRHLTADRLATLLGDFNRSPAYRGLSRSLQELIGDGRIPLDTRLPSERALTQTLGLSRNTVTRAYAELIATGFATTRQGAGTYATAPIQRRRAHDPALYPRPGIASSADALDLTCAADAATPGVAAAYQRALARLPAYLGSAGYLPSGLPDLQAMIAHAYAQRGLPTQPQQIIITSGALSALAVVTHALSRPGDRVLLESPVYSNAIQTLRLGGGRLISLPLTDPLNGQGWDVADLKTTLQQTSPTLAYLIPDFQNPTGLLMSDTLRADYATALRKARTTAIIDETLQATALSDDPMPAPFAVHAPDAITIGSLSKLFWGGLRVGWIRAPRPLINPLIAARVHLDLGSSLFDQLVITELLDKPDILAQRRMQLRQRRDALAQALHHHLPHWRFRLPAGGLSLWIHLPHGSATGLCIALERAGIHLAPGPIFNVDGGSDHWLRIPYARPEAELTHAIARIAPLCTAAAPPPRSTRQSARHWIA